MKENIHIAITRRVKPGHEKAFEQAILAFFASTAGQKGVLGAQLLRPLPGTASNSYGILRSFEDQKAQDAFYQSPEFRQWQKAVEPMVEGEYSRKKMHGLEAFFADPSVIHNPPKWKMAVVTWLGVWPTVFAVSMLLAPLRTLPAIASVAVDTALVVVLLSWLVMPFLTKLFRPWLRQQKRGNNLNRR